MTDKKPKSRGDKPAPDSTQAVDQFMSALTHTHKAEIQELRQIILGAHASISEGIKWNAPSFRTTEYFATTHLRDKAGIGLILHLGAKVRDIASVPVDDPTHLLKWLGKDRAAMSFTSLDDIEQKKAALQAVVLQWIRHV